MSTEVSLVAKEFMSGNDQKTSADAAARGQTIGSRFCGEDCSVHRSCCPPRTRDCWAVVRFAKGGKEYAYEVLEVRDAVQQGEENRLPAATS